jgi:RimJ/RimL family protein N-acetyltransferase
MLLEGDTAALAAFGADVPDPLTAVASFIGDKALYEVLLDDELVGARYLGGRADGAPGAFTTGGFLAKAHRGRGVGTGMLTVASSLAQRLGATSLETRTATSNAAANGALTRAGFSLVELTTRELASGTTEPANLYRKAF